MDFQILDILCLEMAFLLACLTRKGFQISVLTQRVYQGMFFVLILISFVSAILLHTFKNVLRRGYYVEAVATLKQTALVTMFALSFLFATKTGHDFSRIVLFLTAIYYFFLSYFIRRLWRNNIRKRQIKNKGMILLIATMKEAPELIRNYLNNSFMNIGIKGLAITDCSVIGQQINGHDVLADRCTVEEYARNHWVDEVFFGLSVDRLLVKELEEVFLEMGITVHRSLIESTFDNQFERRVERIGGYTVLTRSITILSAGNLFLKRFMDIIGGIVGSLMALALIIIFGPIIYIASPGPILFVQKRVGQNGKYFNMYKLRSMYPDAEARKAELMKQNEITDNRMFKMDYDPRIIGSEKGKGKGVGNFIRRTSIDEFPQFFNVLKGDMSLVGTRPPTIEEWQEYENHHRARLATKPGITGMWQVSGRSDITDFERVVKFDMEYIENWSIGLDIKILGKTIVQVLKGEGAR